jgi:GNAT superfamily N-acetyltransferase
MMQLPNGEYDLAPGTIVAIVTSLEMRAPPPRRPDPPDAPWRVRHVVKPELAWFRDLFRRIGGDLFWASRLVMSDARLADVIHHPQIEVRALERDGRAEGLLELDFRAPGTCELSFFGVTPALVASGAGRFLMNRALDVVWARDIKRFWVHTCTLDHPAALPFYLRSGFVPFRRHVEIVADPRLTGVFPRTAAPQFPVI